MATKDGKATPKGVATLYGMVISASGLTTTQRAPAVTVLNQVVFLNDFISAKFVQGSGDAAKWIASTAAMRDRLLSDRIVFRTCYDHLLPIVEAKLEEGTVAVRGTPGIGKTIFGLFLLRSFLERKRSTVYWDGMQATLFTKEEKYIKLFGLEQTCDLLGEKWHWGAWLPTQHEALGEFLLFEDIYVIHDPALGFISAGSKVSSEKLVIILSFGHALISHWATKRDGAPAFTATVPVFECDEITSNKDNLFHGTGITDDDSARKYEKFGGSIRHWTRSTENEAWQELLAKIVDVSKHGIRITGRTQKHKESVVHVAVNFDSTRPLFPEQGHNTFQKGVFFLGSVQLTELFSREMAGLGREQLRAFMNAVRGERGAEALYGVLFEKYAHDVLCRPEVELHIRAVRYDGKNKFGYATTKIQLKSERPVRGFKGLEANGICELAAMEGTPSLDPNSYFLPFSGSFPTYDSAIVVPGNVVGLPQHKVVGLPLQMTVSGATGIPRRPKHKVKNYMRKAMHTALKQALPSAQPDISVTTFCVPTACFLPFLYQPEERKDSHEPVAAGNQAEFQFVMEIPDFADFATQLPVSTEAPDTIHGASGRTHRYMLRSASPKRMKLDELYETEDMALEEVQELEASA